LSKFPFYKQADEKDCGPTCIRIIAKFYKKTLSIQQIRRLSETNRGGSTLLGLSNAAESIGFKSLGVRLNLEKIVEAPLPCILYWNKEHFVVLYKVDKEGSAFYISDPSYGLITYSKNEFLQFWIGKNAKETTKEGIALLLEPTPKFFNTNFKNE
jgi:ATP-binding cassette subfamily B protein